MSKTSQRNAKAYSHICKNGIILKPAITTNYIQEILPKNVRFEKSYVQGIHKVKFSKLDQKNLEEKVKEWRQERLSDVFFHGYGEVVDEANNGKSKWNGQ